MQSLMAEQKMFACLQKIWQPLEMHASGFPSLVLQPTPHNLMTWYRCRKNLQILYKPFRQVGNLQLGGLAIVLVSVLIYLLVLQIQGGLDFSEFSLIVIGDTFTGLILIFWYLGCIFILQEKFDDDLKNLNSLEFMIKSWMVLDKSCRFTSRPNKWIDNSFRGRGNKTEDDPMDFEDIRNLDVTITLLGRLLLENSDRLKILGFEPKSTHIFSLLVAALSILFTQLSSYIIPDA
jgi:hypothetical protein